MSSTANPRHPNNPPSDPQSEPTGPVTKDSLAADSVRSGGGFSENENPEILGVKGYQSTLTNTDTSGAEVLHAASSGAAREAQDAKGLGRNERGEVGVKYPDSGATEFEGTHSLEGYRGGPSGSGAGVGAGAGVSDTTTGSGSGGSSGSTSDTTTAQTSTSTTKNTNTNTDTSSGSGAGAGAGAGSRPYVPTAPNYTIDATDPSDLKPKGDNLTEGGDVPSNKDTYVEDIGGPNDPGRVAEREFAKVAADSSGGTGARSYGDVEGTGDGSNPYERLEGEERA